MVLVFAEHHDGQFKKTSFEAVTFGAGLAKSMGSECVAMYIGSADNAGVLGTYGASRVIGVNASQAFDDQVFTTIITGVAQQIGAKAVVLSHSSTGKALVGRLAIRLDAASASSVTSASADGSDLVIARPTFSGKAIAHYRLHGGKFVLTLMNNAVPPVQTGTEVQPESMEVDGGTAATTVKEVRLVEGTVPLTEAELVVSAGRGMKDPGNWGIIEELAKELGASTACSRPVADSDWRPHHEHVGQTGFAIRPNLYIAIGISGAIQHLAGVNNSKVIVVINKDPEAPFFKAADYGVEGDLFEVVPRLTEAVRRFKQQ